MTITEFTKDEVEYLLSLRAVSSVSNGRIRYSEEFKRECMEKYAAGESPVKIFRDAGLDPVLIGYKRIERCISRWHKRAMKDALLRGGVAGRRCPMPPRRVSRMVCGIRSCRNCICGTTVAICGTC